VLEATTLGAAFLAGMAVGIWAGEDDVAATWSPRATVEPAGATDRQRWREACERAREWVPELSALNF
jgi:glycerol kinase